MLVLVDGGKREYPEKNPQSKDENQQQTRPTYDYLPESSPDHIGGRASALATAPSLLPKSRLTGKCYLGVIASSVVGSLDTPSTLSHFCLSAVINAINTIEPIT